jgi:hypothetical protein
MSNLFIHQVQESPPLTFEQTFLNQKTGEESVLVKEKGIKTLENAAYSMAIYEEIGKRNSSRSRLRRL